MIVVEDQSGRRVAQQGAVGDAGELERHGLQRLGFQVAEHDHGDEPTRLSWSERHAARLRLVVRSGDRGAGQRAVFDLHDIGVSLRQLDFESQTNGEIVGFHDRSVMDDNIGRAICVGDNHSLRKLRGAIQRRRRGGDQLAGQRRTGGDHRIKYADAHGVSDDRGQAQHLRRIADAAGARKRRAEELDLHFRVRSGLDRAGHAHGSRGQI